MHLAAREPVKSVRGTFEVPLRFNLESSSLNREIPCESQAWTASPLVTVPHSRSNPDSSFCIALTAASTSKASRVDALARIRSLELVAFQPFKLLRQAPTNNNIQARRHAHDKFKPLPL